MNRGKTQTSRKAAATKAAKMEDQIPMLNNGANGKANGYAQREKLKTGNSESSENIFLFYPNIIGM